MSENKNKPSYLVIIDILGRDNDTVSLVYFVPTLTDALELTKELKDDDGEWADDNCLGYDIYELPGEAKLIHTEDNEASE